MTVHKSNYICKKYGFAKELRFLSNSTILFYNVNKPHKTPLQPSNLTLKIYFWEYSIIMNKHRQKPIDMQHHLQMYFGTILIVWVPKKMCPKSSCNLFLYIFYAKTKYSLWILKNKNLFMSHKHPSPNALNIKYFWTLCCNHWGFLSITKLSDL